MHIIRLRGPWQLEPVARYVARGGGQQCAADDLPAPGRAQMPADWSATCGPDFRGVVRYRRSFQQPTGLTPGDTVRLVVEPPQSRATVRLADQELGIVRFNGPPGRFDITRLLADHNQLEIVVEHPAPDDPSESPGGLVGEVRLEIEERSEAGDPRSES
jgi:hypothetical protein